MLIYIISLSLNYISNENLSQREAIFPRIGDIKKICEIG